MKYKIEPKIEIEINGEAYSHKLFESLKLLNEMNSQRAVAKELQISHSVLNRRIKNAEDRLGFKIVKISGSRTYLTKKSKNLVNIYEKYNSRVSENEKITIAGGHIVTNFLDSISTEIPFEADIYSSDDITAYKLAEKGFIDILALDDPQIAFEKDLDFTVIGYDSLVLVSNDQNEYMKIKKMKDMENLNFVSIEGNAQRLAWNTFDKNKIPYKIIKIVKSEFDAFKIVQNSNKLYTFLNASYFKGNKVLEKETKHAISLIAINPEKKEVQEFIEYFSNEGQELISQEGFVPIRPWKTKKRKIKLSI
ncbi:hypothetical protein SDC9_17840 [bioreactor metagenome]|uniref:HTH lysR-type domain-containing protein n=1 Tax=bioreactor metagenome TaxID=1076179 RepID=A0A644TYT4_9ZZZZ|nr:LysR family transcriptional regulator [Methanobrevibacter sp.]MEA4956441.1 LysR family transcriptional regulator [Methanobrevibacter sp.]